MKKDYLKEGRSKNKIQFIVNDGILYNKRDILMLLRDLGNVIYYEVKSGTVVNKGRGYIMRVSSSSEEPTLFLAGRIYINVTVFDYMRVHKVKGSDRTMFELFGGDRVIKIIPDDKQGQAPLPQSLFADKLIEFGIMSDDEAGDREDLDGLGEESSGS